MKKLIFAFLCLSLALGCSKKDETIFLLPEGYTGYVVIIYGQTDGKEKKYEGSKRIYEIPSSGILKTKFSIDYGISNFPKFYYEDKTSKELAYYHEFNEIPEGKIVSFGGTTGKANIDLEGKYFISFTEHYVGTKEEIKLAVEKANAIDYLKLVGN